MTEKNTDTSIVLLYLHKHRVNDLENWLRSLANVAQLQVLLIVSKNTIDHVQALYETGHIFTLHTLDENEPQEELKYRSSLALLYREFSRNYRSFKLRYLKSREILAQYKQAVLITYDDRISSLLPILKASYKLSIPVFLPALLTTRPDITATTSNTLKPQRKVEFLIAWFAKKIFPHHVNNDGRLFYDTLNYVVLLLFRAVPKRPWIKGSQTYTSKLGVESKLAYDKLLEAGVAEHKLELTGMPVYDLMDFNRDEHGSQPLLLCALPQYGEHGAMSVEKALPIIEEILTAFGAFSGEVVISLHPRMDPEIYQPIVEGKGYRCVVGNIDVWLRKASCFFAASSSTTIYSSVIMGIPTVALNHVPPRSNIFKDLTSLNYIDENASLEIDALIRNPKLNWDDLIKKDQQLLSKPLVTDGNCGLRNLNIIIGLSNRVR